MGHKLPVPLPLLKAEERKICNEGKGTLSLFNVSIYTKKKKIMISNFSLSL